MATNDQGAIPLAAKHLEGVAQFKLGVVTAEWNPQTTDALLKGCIEALKLAGMNEENITSIRVPGSYELVSGSQILFENTAVEAVICLGCVIQGETRHFDFICQAVASGLNDVAIKFSKPVIFGVLTTQNQQQASERAGGKLGNKGTEAAETALKMIALKRSMYQTKREITGFKRSDRPLAESRED